MEQYVLVAVGWPYANGDLHVGHLAGANLPADIFARYHRLVGNKVLMVSGSDSHGTPTLVAAEAEGVSPKHLFERYHERFLTAQQDIGISFDLFTHTDTENHHRVAQDIFTKLLDAGYLVRQTQSLLYSESQKRFLPDRYVEGECPHCHYPEARGDQCDECGHLLDAIELINPRSRIDDSKPVVKETEHFFLDLPAFAEMLEAYLTDGKEDWRPNVINFALNYIRSGLKPRPITRDITWGIKVPVEGWQNKRLYVWFEAVIGYLSASIEWSQNNNKPDAWKDYWYNPDALTYYFIGKDNIPFHVLIWPAELHGVGSLYHHMNERLNLPTNVPANEFMNIEMRQLSKSRNWAVWLPDILERYDADAIRYYISAIMPESRDTDFDWEGFVSRNNNELVATWGNLANRMLGFAYKRFDGRVPDPGILRPKDLALIDEGEQAFTEIGADLSNCNFRAGLQTAFALAKQVNQYLDNEAPWFQIKTDPELAAKTVYTALRMVDNLKTLLSPYLPYSSQALHNYLGYEGAIFGEINIETFAEAQSSHNALVYDASRAIGTWQPSNLPPGQQMRQPKPLFKKLDESVAEVERQRMIEPSS